MKTKRNDSVNWYSDKMLKENYQASISMYKFIERDFNTCLEYVGLIEEHLQVYSYRFASLILRIGPEILRLFNLILFNRKRTAHLAFDREIRPYIVELEKKYENRADNVMHYLRAMRNVRIGGLDAVGVRVKALDKYILPFDVEKRQKSRSKSEPILCDVIPWWEDGYNALRHRATKEFKQSATFQNALFSLAGIWVLHDAYLGHDWGFSLESEIFDSCSDRWRIETQRLPVLKYTRV